MPHQSFVNSKGLTTVPVKVRRALGLEGETIVWTLTPVGAVLVRAKYVHPGAETGLDSLDANPHLATRPDGHHR
jgi:bifunctional DNA-binding transcriptional regulator/antitoxin component of YhaV-PrlF toxin-antitoxin module